MLLHRGCIAGERECRWGSGAPRRLRVVKAGEDGASDGGGWYSYYSVVQVVGAVARVHESTKLGEVGRSVFLYLLKAAVTSDSRRPDEASTGRLRLASRLPVPGGSRAGLHDE